VTADLVIRADGTIEAIYTDAVPFRELAQALGGDLRIARASHVEPTPDGLWSADMELSGGGVLGPFDLRQEALEAEVRWLRREVLGVQS
jgi:hypothetical protein